MGNQPGKEGPSSTSDSTAEEYSTGTKSPSTPEAFFQKLLQLPAVVSEKAVKATGSRFSVINAGDHLFPRSVHSQFHALHRDLIAANLLHLAALIYETRDIIEEYLVQFDGAAEVQLIGFPEKGALDSSNDDMHQCFLIRYPTHVAVVFRGTEMFSLKEWMVDLSMELRPVKESLLKGKMHSGFMEGMNAPRRKPTLRPSLYDEITTVLDQWEQQYGKLPLFITGHSLGGALSIAFSATLVINNKHDQIGGIYTFGQPRCGDADFAQSFDELLGDKLYRYVAHNDIVARVPPDFVKYREKMGTLVFLGRNIFDHAEQKVIRGGEAPPIDIRATFEHWILTPVAVMETLKAGLPKAQAIARATLPHWLQDHYPLAYETLLESVTKELRAEFDRSQEPPLAEAGSSVAEAVRE